MVVVYVLLFVVLVLFPGYGLIVRPWHLRWGTTNEERRRALPGDERIAQPRLSYTRAINIAAPTAEVWPWLIQIGYQRAGWYSYDRLEQLVGAADFVDGHRSARRIVPELQTLAVGDTLRFAKEPAPGFTVMALEPSSLLLLGGEPAPDESPAKAVSISWAFVLEQTTHGTTRLIVRQRLAFAPSLANWAIWLGVEAFNFVMERKMLLGLKERVERQLPPSPIKMAQSATPESSVVAND